MSKKKQRFRHGQRRLGNQTTAQGQMKSKTDSRPEYLADPSVPISTMARWAIQDSRWADGPTGPRVLAAALVAIRKRLAVAADGDADIAKAKACIAQLEGELFRMQRSQVDRIPAASSHAIG